MKDDTVRRITLVITPELSDRLSSMRHGLRGPLLMALLTAALDSIDREGEIMVGALLSGKYKIVPDYEKAA